MNLKLQYRSGLKKHIKELEREIEKLDEDLFILLIQNDGEPLVTQHFTLRLMPGRAGKKSISEERLLVAGVPKDTIAECTIHGETGKDFVQVFPCKQKEEG